MDKISEPSSMVGKLWIEICLISARGLPRSSFLKYQWYSVGWTDPNNKYCTKIDASGNANPVWKTKFTTAVDASVSADLQDMVLNVEVYSREPLFLREKLQGTASIMLKEFLFKYSKNSEEARLSSEDVGSFQLRKKRSNEPRGFIDISVKISEEKEGTSSCSYLGNERFNLQDNSNGITLATGAGPMLNYTAGQAEPAFNMPEYPQPPAAHPYAHPVPYPRNYSHPSVGMPSYPPATGPSYPVPQMPPPPPTNAGYMPTFLPQTNNQSTTYMNMPASGSVGRGAGRGAGLGPAFGVGLGAGAVAAGAVVYCDDFMSGFELPTGLRAPSLTVSIDSPF